MKKARIALTEVRGEIASTLERAVHNGLKPHPQVALVPRKTWRKTASRLGGGKTSVAFVKAAKKLHVTSALESVAVKEGSGWTASLRVRDGASGNYVRTWKISEPSKATLLKRIESQLFKELRPALLRPGNMMPEPLGTPSSPEPIAEKPIAEKRGPPFVGPPWPLPEIAPERHVVVPSTAETPAAEAPIASAEKLPLEKDALPKPIVEKSSADRPDLVGPPKALARSPGGDVLARIPMLMPSPRPGRLPGLFEIAGPPKPVLGGGQAPDPAAGTTAALGPGTRVETAPPSARTASAHNETPLEVSIGVNYLTRSLSYKDDLFKALRPYSLSGAPALRIEAAWYPAAHFTKTFARNIGLDLIADYTPAIDSGNAAGTKFPTKTSSLEGGLVGRWPFGPHEVALHLGGGRHSFEVRASDRGVRSNVPAVDYVFLRLGLDARFAITDLLSVRAQAGWRRIFSAGDIHSQTWFPGAKLAGIDGSVVAGYEIFPQIEVQLGIEARRYYYVLEPEPGDTYIVGGAVDQYFIGRAGVAFYLGAP